MAFHLLAFTRGGPAVEFLLQLLVGSLWFFSHDLVFDCGTPLRSNCAVRIQLGRQPYLYATGFLFMATRPPDPPAQPGPGALYCPNCAEEVSDPLTCGDCSAVICRRCGSPLESADERGMG